MIQYYMIHTSYDTILYDRTQYDIGNNNLQLNCTISYNFKIKINIESNAGFLYRSNLDYYTAFVAVFIVEIIVL